MTSKTFKTRRTNITPNPDGVLSGSDMSLLGCQREIIVHCDIALSVERDETPLALAEGQ